MKTSSRAETVSTTACRAHSYKTIRSIRTVIFFALVLRLLHLGNAVASGNTGTKMSLSNPPDALFRRVKRKQTK
jgi:hypothetical protein